METRTHNSIRFVHQNSIVFFQKIGTTLAFLTPASAIGGLNFLRAQDVGLTDGLRNFHLLKTELSLFRRSMSKSGRTNVVKVEKRISAGKIGSLSKRALYGDMPIDSCKLVLISEQILET
jgi:hypothetical protein